MKVLILAGGRGKRLNDLTESRNKSLLEIFEKPLIEYNLDEAVKLNPGEIILVVGYKGEEIIKKYGGCYKGISIKYSVQKEQRGLVNAIACSKKLIGDSDFVLMLADEIVAGSKIRQMLKKFYDEDLFAICGVVFENNKESIGKTYSAMVNEKGRVYRLIEKPRFPINSIKGTGHCIMKNEMLSYIERTPINANRGEKELVDMIQCAVDEGKKVNVYPISPDYTNVNTHKDMEISKRIIIKHNPKILIVHPQMKFFGGAELLIAEFANWLTKHGYKNSILALSKSKEIEESLIGTELIIPENDIKISSSGFNSAKDVLKGIKTLRKEIGGIHSDFDLINLHNFPATWALFPRKKPSVWMLNEPPNLWSRPNAGIILKIMNKLRNALDKFIVKKIDVICVSDEFNRKRCLERYGKDSKIVNYGINHDFFSKGIKENAVKKYGLKGKFVVLQSGVLSEQKNQMESIKTIERLKDRIKNIILILAGKAEGDYEARIKKYIGEKNLDENVILTGNLGRMELRDLYAAADLGLFPIKSQGGWLAPFEFLCSGHPIIVSKEFTASNLIMKNDLGAVSDNYPEDLLKILKNKKEYLRKAKKSAEWVKNNLSWDMFGKRMLEAFKEAIERHYL